MNPVVIYLNLSQGAAKPILATAGGTQVGSPPSFTLRDLINLRLVFFRNGENVQLADTAIRLGGKATSNLSSEDLLFSASNFVESVADTLWVYDAPVNFNTVNAIGAFTGNTKTVPIVCDIQLQADDNSERVTLQFDTNLRRDVVTGDEPEPEEGEPIFPSPPTANTSLGADADGNWIERTKAQLLEFLSLNGFNPLPYADEAALAALVVPAGMVAYTKRGTLGDDFSLSRWCLQENTIAAVTTAGTYVVSTGVPGYVWVAA